MREHSFSPKSLCPASACAPLRTRFSKLCGTGPNSSASASMRMPPQSYATAERDLRLPTISAVGTAGLIPFRQDTLSPRYAAAGFNVNIPLFNGHLFGALHTEASERAQAQSSICEICRIVSFATFARRGSTPIPAFSAFPLPSNFWTRRISSLDLAQSRYKLGLSSIVELSQAQLNQTQAQIAQASAKYDYEAQISALNYQTGSLH